MTDWEKKKAEKARKLQGFAHAVASWMDGWEYRKPEGEDAHWVAQIYLMSEDGQRARGPTIHLTQDHNGRVEVSGVYPRDNQGQACQSLNAQEVRIGVSITRDPRAAARDIQRRFIPRYLDYYRETMQVREARDRAVEERKDIARKILEQSGHEDEVYSRQALKQGGVSSYFQLHLDNPRAAIRIYSEAEVSLEARMTAQQVFEVLDLLRATAVG